MIRRVASHDCICRRLGLLAAVLGNGDIHVVPVPHPAALQAPAEPFESEARASAPRSYWHLRHGLGSHQAFALCRAVLALASVSMRSLLSSRPVPVLVQEADGASGGVEAGQEQPRLPLVRLGGGVVLAGSRIVGSCPAVAAWLPIAPHDLLLVRRRHTTQTADAMASSLCLNNCTLISQGVLV